MVNKQKIEVDKVIPTEILQDILTRAARAAARVRLGAALDNLKAFSYVCKAWNDAVCSADVWNEVTPEIWGAEAVEAIVAEKHHTLYKRFSEFKLVHVKLPLPSPFGPQSGNISSPFGPKAKNVTALAVSNTHVIFGTCWGQLFSCMLPNLNNFQEYNMPKDYLNGQMSKLVGINHNGPDIFVGRKSGSVLRARLDSLDVVGTVFTVTDCGPMIDFTGTKEHLVGLFAGLEAFCVWKVQPNNIELIYKGGDFFDNIDYIQNNITDAIHGRIRLADNIVVACNEDRIISFDIMQPKKIRTLPIRSFVSTFDVGTSTFMVVKRNKSQTGIISRVEDFKKVCRFSTYSEHFIGFQNKYVAFLHSPYGGTTTGWDVVTGKRFREMRRRIEDVKLMIASDRYLVALTTKGNGEIHVWDASKEGIDLGSDVEDEQHD